MNPSVYSIILNWNDFEDTDECVQSLLKLDNDMFEIVLVDNGSTDSSGQQLSEKYANNDRISTILLDENRGYAGGMNAGIDRALDAGAEYIWLLNNDTVVSDSDVVEKLTGVFERNPSLGAVSPTIVDKESGEVLFDGFSPGVFIPQEYARQNIREFQDSVTDLALNYGVSFSSVVLSADAIRDVGVLPEHYFMYVEDIEYRHRLEQAGYRVATHTDVTIEHASHGSTSPHGQLPTYYKTRNWILFIARCSPEPRSLFVLHYLYFLLTRSIHRFISGKWSSLYSMGLGLTHGLHGREGKGPYP